MTAFGRRMETEDALLDRAPPEASTPAGAPMAEAQSAIYQRLQSLVMEQLDPAFASKLSIGKLLGELEPLVHALASRERMQISAHEQVALARELAYDMVGFGPLEPLLQDDSIADIMVNGPDDIFIESHGKLRRSNVRFRDAAHAAAVAQKMAATIGRRVDESSPLCDARLPDGSRVNIVFPPLALNGPCISIRKFARRKIDFSGMVERKSLSAGAALLLEIAGRARLNVVVSGGTGSGKTTMLNAMSRSIDDGERIVTIEDAAELQLQQPHVVRLETRPPNLEGRGEITQRELLKNALRMRPDRIIVGEVRGAEAFDMLQAMNTGHDGSFCTVHANTTRDALIRIENMVQMGSLGLPVRAIRTQITSAIDLIVQLQRMRDGVRRVTQISEVCGLEGDIITMNEVAIFECTGEDAQGGVRGQFRGFFGRPKFLDRLAYFGLDRAWMEALQAI